MEHAQTAEKRLLASDEQATVDDVAAAHPRDIDWAVANAAIVRRWSKNALRYITGRVWEIDISRLPAESVE
jgi:hypothetical protein